MSTNLAQWRLKMQKHLVILALAACTGNSVMAGTMRWNTGGGNWSDSSSWTPAVVPGSDDTGVIGSSAATHGKVVTLDKFDTVGHLEIAGGATFDNGGRRLIVFGNTSLVGDGAAFASRLDVRQAPGFASDVTTRRLDVSDKSRVRLFDGAQLFVEQFAEIQDGGVLSGIGTLQMGEPDPASAEWLRNAGTIQAGAGPLTINIEGSDFVDLDGGPGTGRLYAQSTNASGTSSSILTVNGGRPADSFKGEMRIGGGSEIRLNFDEPWSLNSNGSLQFTRDLRHPGVGYLRGADATLSGNVNVSANANGVITAKTTIEDAATFNAGPGAALDLLGETRVNGGQFISTGDGHIDFSGTTTWAGNITSQATLYQDGNAVVAQPTVVDGGTLDLDGHFGSTQWDIDRSLTLNVDRIDTGQGNEKAFGGSMDIGGHILSRATINLPDGDHWEMAGNLNLSGNVAFPVTRLGGSPMLLTGEMDVAANVATTTEITFANGSVTTMDNPADKLVLNGNSTIQAGAVFIGNGTLRNDANMLLSEGVDTAATKIHNNGTLQIATGVGSAALPELVSTDQATIAIDVGKVSGIDFARSDQLVVDGPVDLAGTLQLAYSDEAPLRRYEAWQMIDGQNLTGKFDSIIGMRVDDQTSFAVTYEGDDVFLQAAFVGDANLDGRFNSSDMVDVFAAGQYEDDVENNSVWATGDWTGDGEFDTTDLVAAFRGGAYETSIARAAIQSVPEPCSSVLVGLAMLSLLSIRRRNR